MNYGVHLCGDPYQRKMFSLEYDVWARTALQHYNISFKMVFWHVSPLTNIAPPVIYKIAISIKFQLFVRP